MPPLKLPSLEIPLAEKASFTEAEVHSKLFEPDMRSLGYPKRTSSQSEGEYFLEQRTLAMRRLKSKKQRGHYDGLYLVGNSPVVLCEIKRYEMLATPAKLTVATKQLQAYARSEDFEGPPPFLLLYSGDPEHTRFYRLQPMPEGTATPAYELLPEIWSWERVRDAHVRGAFAEEVVDRSRLQEILLHHLDQFEDDLRAPIAAAVEIVGAPEEPELLTGFGKWLTTHAEARSRFAQLYQRKVAELGGENRRRVAEEMVTQAALNQLNKVFFLNLCEDRNLPGFYRIMREFLPTSKSDATPTEAAVFLGLLRRKIRDVAGDWRDEDERAYRDLRAQLTPQIGASVIEQNNWWELIRVAFDLAAERFPLVYRDDAYDYFRPKTATLADLVFDLSTKSFSALTNQNVGDIYQGLLSSRRTPGEVGGRRRRQAKLGAFYTPQGDVDYMVSKLELKKDSRVLDPCMGSGHFLEGIYEALRDLYLAEGHAPEEIYKQVVGKQLVGGDIDTFATSLSAIRMFLLDEHQTRTPPNLFVHDMLLHTPERPASELFSGEALATGVDMPLTADQDRGVDELLEADEIEFDAVVGNPPYGAKKPAYKTKVYRELYGATKAAIEHGSRGTGDGDSYAMFIASGIERLKEGGRLCFITNDSFRTLTTHARLRRMILDRCKIIEILLTDTRHFEGVSFQFAGMAITTLQKCSDPVERGDNEMRLVDYVRDPKDFWSPPSGRVTLLRQAEYEELAETPFFVGVPREIFESVKGSGRVADVARGRQGLATADDKRFLAGIGGPFPGLPNTIQPAQLATAPSEDEQRDGIDGAAHFVPFSKGEGFGEYWREPAVAIDWSKESVAELEKRAAWPAGRARRVYFRNRSHFFQPGLNYSVISSGRVSARLMPEGWIFGHKGSAVFTEDPDVDELFLLGYLNSSLATYFMKRMVNTTATADVGYIEKLPFRKADNDLAAAVSEHVKTIIDRRETDADADITDLRSEIDDRIFDLFEIETSRQIVLDFYSDVGRVEQSGDADDSAPIDEDQAAIE